MGALGLDLTASRAKVTRAREHYVTLCAEAHAAFDARPPYSVRLSDVDNATGWCSVYVTPRGFSEPRLGVLVGDLVHNLRSALDYIVIGLVLVAGASVTTGHKFPIFDDPGKFRKTVYSPAGRPALRKHGPLDGVLAGADLVEELHPYHRPDPHSDPLWHVCRFSNADKHREITAFSPWLSSSGISFEHDGTIVGDQKPAVPPDGPPDQEYEALRVRFALPAPTYLRYKANFAIAPMFTTGAIGNKDPHGVGIEVFTDCCEHVDLAINLFSQL